MTTADDVPAAAAAVGPRRFGANYVPSSGWFYSWLDFDADATRRDFADLAGLGLDHVRIFPIWPWIQPNRGHLRGRAVDDVVTMIDLAAEAGLDVSVDLLQGHLSSFDFLPSWVLTWHAASVFDDARTRAGIIDYARTLTTAVTDRPNVFAITLGNEVNNLWPANSATQAASRSWAEELLGAVRESAPDVPALYSLYDDALYSPDHPFAMADIVELGDLTSIHSWIFNGVAKLDGPLGPATVSHADYMIELAAAFSNDPARPVWLQEVGAPRPELDDLTMGDFVASTMSHVAENPALWGVTWWCSHDIDRRLVDFPEREYDLGLFTVDHRRKPVADAYAKAIDAARTVTVPTERSGIVCPVDIAADPGSRAEVAPGSEFHRAWVDARVSGPVGIVPSARTQDAAYLSARGITL